MRLALGVVVAVACVVVASSFLAPPEAVRGPTVEGGDASPQDAWKAAHAARVYEELRTRDVSHLRPEQRARRARALEELAAYGRRGRFAQNDEFPGEAIPHLIDDAGTRCALANLIDTSGAPELLQRLAAADNTAFVPALQQDGELQQWLDTNGFTIEEAAYIQGPGFVDPGPSARDPSDRFPTGDPTGGPGGPTTRSAPTMGGARTRAGWSSSSVATWDTWWSLNRHAFLNLRQRYHAGAVVTGTDGGGESTRGRRPTEAELNATILPLLQKLATGSDDSVRATALMAWARAARPEHGAAVVAALKDYLRDEGNQYRELMILALGVVQHGDAIEPLRGILQDTKEGRAALGRKGAITERTRAHAAIALGQAGQAAVMTDLMAVLDDKRSKAVDLKACCVMALGTLATDAEPADRRKMSGYLVRALRAGAWPDVVLAAVPTALANAGDELLYVGTLQPILERFRKPTQVRQSAALALAAGAPALTEPLCDTLIATARRDPDDNARRFGIVALGEVAARQECSQEAEARLGAKLKSYYAGAFAGRNIQKTDLPWLCLSAALFGRGFPDHADDMAQRLRRIASKSGQKERQAAAIVSLGILGDRASLPILQRMAKDAKDKRLKGYLVETLGILGDKSEREALLTLVQADPTGSVRYQAALGLGFTADAELVGSLAETLATTRSAEAKAALARVIGELGDRTVLPALARVAADEKADVWTRRRALGAIGMIAEEEDHAWTRAFHRGANYTAATPTLRTILALF